MEKNCVNCGEKFKTENRLKVYCSIKCGQNYNYQKLLRKLAAVRAATARQGNCVTCGAEFTTNVTKKRFCSIGCITLPNGNLWKPNLNGNRTKVCVGCAAVFAFTMNTQTYCTKLCRSRVDFERNKNTVQNCEICGKEFAFYRKPSRPTRRVCGKGACQIQILIAKRREQKPQIYRKICEGCGADYEFTCKRGAKVRAARKFCKKDCPGRDRGEKKIKSEIAAATLTVNR